MKDDIKLCEGCRSTEACFLQEDINVFIVTCPCRQCLIKTMCNDPCEEYNENHDACMVKAILQARDKEE